jgi:polysaccharide biosynthesis/export protein
VASNVQSGLFLFSGYMAVNRTAVVSHAVTLALVIAFGAGTISRAADAQKAPPKELVKYIRESRDRGTPEDRIKQQAVTIGWEPAVVEAAFELLNSGKAQTPEAAEPGVSASAGAARNEVAGAPESPGLSDNYQIGSGDTLQISVWKEPDVTVPSVVVRPDGRITVPLVKDVEVGGLTPRQAEKVITQGLAKYITEPNVTVVVAAINSKKIYVIGGARKEGPLPYTYGMTVMQALSESGGLSDYAKRKKIYILRTENGREYRLDFNYDEVVKGERMNQNVLLLPGDTVVIPR